MSLIAIPPVRRALPLSFREDRVTLPFDCERTHFFASGTQALAAALNDSAWEFTERTNARPEAIIPAYGCPDLVTACMAAGVFPRMVEVEGDEWGYNLASLQASIGDRTIAIVAVNLLGLGDQASQL